MRCLYLLFIGRFQVEVFFTVNRTVHQIFIKSLQKLTALVKLQLCPVDFLTGSSFFFVLLHVVFQKQRVIPQDGGKFPFKNIQYRCDQLGFADGNASAFIFMYPGRGQAVEAI